MLRTSLMWIAMVLSWAIPLRAEMACSLDLREYLSGADLALIGVFNGKHEREVSGFFPSHTVEFRTEYLLRNRLAYQKYWRTVQVWLVSSSTACCYYEFERGQSYLVFTSVHPEMGWLQISQCSVFNVDRFWKYAVQLPEQITYDMGHTWLPHGSRN